MYVHSRFGSRDNAVPVHTPRTPLRAVFATRLDADSTGAVRALIRALRLCIARVHEPFAQACESVFTLRASVGLRRSGAAIHVYTAAAPALSASRRVTKTARSGVLDVHAGIVLYRTLNKTYARTRTLLKLARAFTLRASRRSVTKTARSGVLDVHAGI